MWSQSSESLKSRRRHSTWTLYGLPCGRWLKQALVSPGEIYYSNCNLTWRAAVVVSCLPSFRILLSARSRSDSAYKRRNTPSSSDPSANSGARKQPTLRRTGSIRLEKINARAYLDVRRAERESYDRIIGAERGQTNTIITKSSRTESQEDLSPPRNRVLVRQDMVSKDFSCTTPRLGTITDNRSFQVYH